MCRLNLGKPRLPNAGYHNFFVKHGCGAHPKAMFTVERAVKSEWFLGFAVPDGVDYLVQIAFVVAVQAGRGGDQGGEGF